MAPLPADAKLFLCVLVIAIKIDLSTPNSTISVQTSARTPTTANTPTPAISQGQTNSPSQTNAPQTTEQPINTPSPSTEIPLNTDIATCICDLTGNACDVNCCCDPDCSAADVQTFSQCSENTYVVADRVCVQSSVIYSTDGKQTIDVSDPSLFCIADDNNAERNYYTVPQAVDTVERFYELSQQYGSTSYEEPSAANTSYSDFYKSGDVMYTLYETLSLGQLGLPRGLVSDVCDDTNPAAYLLDETSTCTRELTSLETECETQAFLSARTYYEGFKFIATPKFLQENPLPPPILVNLTTAVPSSTNPTTQQPPATTSNASNVTIDPNATITATTNFPGITDFPGDPFYSSTELVNVSVVLPVMCRISGVGFVVDCNITAEAIPLPRYNFTSTTCEDVVLEVKYIITHNATDGIETVAVELVLGSLTSSDLRPSQTFSTMFVSRDEVDVYHRSGNPGYVIGQPLMAGDLVEEVQLDETIKQAISVGSDPSNWLTVVKSSSDGSCLADAHSRIPVTFGENLRSGCTIQVSYENISDICGLIQATALNALNGNRPGYVATFGNSQPEVVGDWVQIFVDSINSSPVSNERGVCNNMYLAVHIEVMYANVGAVANPQAKILGLRYNYPDGSGQTLRYQCLGPYCQAGAESLVQKFEVSVSVEFIDASASPSTIYAEKPAFQSRLPNDFFYPFSGTSCAARMCSNLLVHPALLFFLLLCTL